MLKALLTLFAFVAISCNSVVAVHQEIPSPSEDIKSLNSENTKLGERASQNCNNFKRPLNPCDESSTPETELDRHFRLAFYFETGGNFEKAIKHYRKAAELSACNCDRLHAEAGEIAAKEARDLLEQQGMEARPTQFFWGRLQELTQTLPCVEIK